MRAGSEGRYVYAIGADPLPGKILNWRITILPINASTLSAQAPVSVHVSQLTYSSWGQQIGRLIIWNDISVAPDGVAYICVDDAISPSSGGYYTLIPVNLAADRRDPLINYRGDLGAALTIYPR